MNNHLETLKQRWLEIVGAEPRDLDELAQGVIQVINSQPATRSGRGRRVQVAGLQWQINFGQVSNSHDRPIQGISNWDCRVHGARCHYPGWHGRVWVRYTRPIDSFGSDPWRSTLTWTGTGGFGGYDGPWSGIAGLWYRAAREIQKQYPEPQIYSWDFRFFLQDWPLLERWVEAQRIEAILRGQKPPGLDHRFLWQDPEILALDDKFRSQYAPAKSQKETA
jgi:hypothetical protein